MKVAGTNKQQEKEKTETSAADKQLNYKTARLWNKPARVMKAAPAPAEPEVVDPYASTAPAANAADAYAVQNAGVTDPYAAYGAQQQGAADPYAAYGTQPQGGVTNPYAAPQQTGGSNPYAQQPAAQPAQGVTNPYDMPYEEYSGQQ